MTATPAVPPITELQAPASWRSADVISDLHLQAAEAGTFEA
jgi:UDP-2,3-diacylglucosamine hydrolase